jgi:hypothetical protein
MPARVWLLNDPVSQLVGGIDDATGIVTAVAFGSRRTA